MNKGLYFLYKFIYPDRLFENQGKVVLGTRQGTLEIPMGFAIYDAACDIFQHTDQNLIGPCERAIDEFVHIDIHANGITMPFDEYDPDADGVPFSDQNHILIITWSINSKKTLVWSASGFR